ncbi:MAG: ferritin-like domain-containing protein [Desulfurococcales archaeon]|nr:ferritin-like domain-containing protein [Desulfurococcales archaeon]
MDLPEVLKEYSRVEAEYSRSLASSVEGLKSPLIRALILGVSKDSEKHSLIYEILSMIASGEVSLISEEDAERIRSEIEEHIRREAEMIRSVEELLKENKDLNPAIRFLLEAVLRDEKLHHALLLRLRDIVIGRYTLTDDDVWEMVWKDAMYHGAPGG